MEASGGLAGCSVLGRVLGWMRGGIIKANTKSSFLQHMQPRFLLVQFVGLLHLFQPVTLKFCKRGRLFGCTVRK